MVMRASRVRTAALGAAFAMAVLGASACKEEQVAPLPKIEKAGPRMPRRPSYKGTYRRQGGGDIAPMEIADDPVAAVAQPAAAGQQPGGSQATLNGDPNGITRDTLNRSIQGAMGALAACFTNITQDPMVAVSFEADPSGRPSLVRVTGAPADAEHCIRNVVQNIRFPSFQGKGVQVDLPLSFHRSRLAPAPQGAGEQPQPGAPPLFLEP